MGMDTYSLLPVGVVNLVSVKVIKNGMSVDSLMAKCTSTINKAFPFFFFFFF